MSLIVEVMLVDDKPDNKLVLWWSWTETVFAQDVRCDLVLSL